MSRIEQIGNATLYLGDCREILPTLEGYDAIVADPPYGISHRRNLRKRGGKKTKRGNTRMSNFVGCEVIGDNEPFDPGFLFGRDMPVILWGANHYVERLPPKGSWLIWDKRRGTAVNDFSDAEIAWTNVKTPIRVYCHLWNGLCRDSEQRAPHLHQTQKPIAVMKWCLSFLPDAHTILDPYMGSGTTGVACANMGKEFVGIEIDPSYFDAACKRIEEAQSQSDLFIPETQAYSPKQEVIL